MRKRLINQLDYKERKWLHCAIIRMIIADNSIAEEEVEDLKKTYAQMVGKDAVNPREVFSAPDVSMPLKRPGNISYEHAFIMLSEIVRVAAIDSKVVLEERELLKEILSLLNFKAEAVSKVLQWAKRLALANKEEEILKNSLRDYYQN